ncbi:hypothetical protein ElyMa_005944400 [Elysia marginata]|uniref:Uncharacterized protein n=1 Tax=Elysia marginata TaxID=1093978 RepID=A0AAV4GAD3_9GAST|nr:hypothetical protein ElyMa_005944400 [Elysia marginata]
MRMLSNTSGFGHQCGKRPNDRHFVCLRRSSVDFGRLEETGAAGLEANVRARSGRRSPLRRKSKMADGQAGPASQSSVVKINATHGCY